MNKYFDQLPSTIRCFVASLAGICLADAAYAQPSVQPEKHATEYLRMTKEAGNPKSLDVAVTTFRSESSQSVQVDLIGAVHIGERDYYTKLNELFDKYDVLLYELVAPEGTVIPKGGKRESTNPVAFLQDSAKSLLGLESQLELVDYTKPHFVRADLTPTQMSQKMTERGETALTIMLSTLADVMRQQNLASQQPETQNLVSGETSLFELMDDPLRLKQIMAQQFVSTGSLDQSLGGSLNQLLVVDRNAAAMKELQKQIAAGKRKIGIFYGAAHMPDFEKRLNNDFGLQVKQQEWITAWDLTKATARSNSEPASLIISLLKALDQ